MPNTDIPRSFWHAVSLCLLTTTVVLLYVAVKSSTVSIEIANAKISLNGAISETEELNQELQEQNEELIKAQEELREKYEQLVAATRNNRGTEITAEVLKRINPETIQLKQAKVSEDRYNANRAKLQDLRKKLE